MISLNATNDTSLLNLLHNRIFGNDIEGKVGYVLYVDDVPIGVAKLNIDATSATLKEVGVLAEYRGKGYGDFFTRSLMNCCIDITDVIYAYKDEYFCKFGFTEENGVMKVESDKLTFPHACKHNEN